MTPRWMRSLSLPVLATGIVLFAFGCAPKSAEEQAAAPARPAAAAPGDATPSVGKAREAAGIALEIEREPGRTTVILESHGMTAEQFEDLLYAIAQDAALSEAYEAARTGTP